MTFTARPYTDWCPTIGHCDHCGGPICDECGGFRDPINCGDELHCAGCADDCETCNEEAA